MLITCQKGSREYAEESGDNQDIVAVVDKNDNVVAVVVLDGSPFPLVGHMFVFLTYEKDHHSYMDYTEPPMKCIDSREADLVDWILVVEG
jgi:hypothetical protein